MYKITLITMNALTIASYILAAIFIILLTRAVYKVVRNNRQLSKNEKRHKAYEKQEKELLKKGLKKYHFNGGQTIVWAKDYKSANAQYQIDRKNGK